MTKRGFLAFWLLATVILVIWAIGCGMEINQVQGTYTGTGSVDAWGVDQNCQPTQYGYTNEGTVVLTGVQLGTTVTGILSMPDWFVDLMPISGTNNDGALDVRIDLQWGDGHYDCDLNISAADLTGDLIADVLQLDPNNPSYCIWYWQNVCNQYWSIASGQLIRQP